VKVQSALALAASGFRVFPLIPNANRPAFKRWQEKATTDENTLSAWWADEPNYNIGVATGQGLLVVDADCKDGRPGLASLDMLDMCGLPSSFRVRTQSGGCHVYLTTGQQHANRVDTIPDYPGIDIRSDGGYVVGPGSTINENPYTISSGSPKSIKPSPTWWDNHLNATASKHVAKSEHPLTDLDLPEHIDKATHYLENTAHEAVEGAGGNDATYRVATALRDYAISESLALELMLEHWNETKASPPWQPDDLATIISNAFSYATGGWGAKTAAAEFETIDIDIGEPPKTQKSLEPPKKIKIIRASQFASQPTPEREFLVKDLIPHANVTTLGGDGATGKSLLAMQLAIAVERNTKWIGHDIAKPGPVLYFSAEDDENETHIRLKEITHSERIPLDEVNELHIALMAGEDALLAVEDTAQAAVLKKTPLFERLRQWASHIKPKLIILDNLADIFGGNENAKAPARQFIGMLRGLAIEFDCAIVMLSHPSLTGMASGSGSSGNVAWNNSVRSRLYLTRDKEADGSELNPNRRMLTNVKVNYGQQGNQFELEWSQGRFVAVDMPDMSGLDGVGDDGTEGGSGHKIADRAGKARGVFMDLMRRFEHGNVRLSPSPGANYAPVRFATHHHARGIRKAEFEKAMDELLTDGEIAVEEVGPPSRRLQKLVCREPFA